MSHGLIWESIFAPRVSTDRGTVGVPSRSGTVQIPLVLPSFNELRRKGFVDIGGIDPSTEHMKRANVWPEDPMYTISEMRKKRDTAE
jgi:hypothetical protein